MVILRIEADDRTAFAVCADVREIGAKHPREIARFDTLETAALVMKYMRGDRLPVDDAIEAKEAIRAVKEEKAYGRD